MSDLTLEADPWLMGIITRMVRLMFSFRSGRSGYRRLSTCKRFRLSVTHLRGGLQKIGPTDVYSNPSSTAPFQCANAQSVQILGLEVERLDLDADIISVLYRFELNCACDALVLMDKIERLA